VAGMLIDSVYTLCAKLIKMFKGARTRTMGTIQASSISRAHIAS
jgi:hypothetical protein